MTVLTVHACTAHSWRNMHAAVETMKQSCRSKEQVVRSTWQPLSVLLLTTVDSEKFNCLLRVVLLTTSVLEHLVHWYTDTCRICFVHVSHDHPATPRCLWSRTPMV